MSQVCNPSVVDKEPATPAAANRASGTRTPLTERQIEAVAAAGGLSGGVIDQRQPSSGR
jgi:hypothetical protein